jgi:hypothetical protein
MARQCQSENAQMHTEQGVRRQHFLFNNSQIFLNLTLSPSPKKKEKNVCGFGNTESMKELRF